MSEKNSSRNRTRQIIIFIRKHRVLAFLLYAASLVLLMEIVLRVVWHNPYRTEQPDTLVRLRLNHQGTDHLIDRSAYGEKSAQVRFRTDDRSYIIPSSQHADPEVTVVFFGGSTTATENIDEENRFPHLTSVLLAEEGIQANCANIARSGNSLQDSLNILLNHVQFDHPDIVVVMHAVNDIGVLRKSGDYTPRAEFVVAPSRIFGWSAQLASSHSHLAGILRWIVTHERLQSTLKQRRKQHQEKPAATAGQPPVPEEPFRESLQAFVALAKSYGIKPVLMTQPLADIDHPLRPPWASMATQERFNEVTRSVAEESGTPLIDLVRHLRNEVPHWDQQGAVFIDGMHVTESGSRIYAERIAAALAPIAREIRRQKQDDDRVR